MGKDTIETIDDLKELAKNSFQVLKANERRKGKLQLSLDVGSYIELQWLIIDIVKVSMAALDACNEEVTDVKNPHHAVRGVLELLLQILPLEEILLLDKMHELVNEVAEQVDREAPISRESRDGIC
jgi:hypothetical protein